MTSTREWARRKQSCCLCRVRLPFHATSAAIWRVLVDVCIGTSFLGGSGGTMRAPKNRRLGMARPYKCKGSRFFWIAPWIQGRQVPQSSGETDYDRAHRKLKILEGKIAANAPISARTDRDSFEALLGTVKTDYMIKKRASLDDTVRRITKHLVPLLGNVPAGKVNSSVIAEYILSRQNEKPPAANASINRELAIIKRAFRL